MSDESPDKQALEKQAERYREQYQREQAADQLDRQRSDGTVTPQGMDSRLDGYDAKVIGDALGRPADPRPLMPLDKGGGGMQQIDPPDPALAGSPTIGGSILDSIEPRDQRARIAEQWGGGEAGRSVTGGNERKRARALRVASLGIAAGGLFLILWAFTGGRIPQPPVATQKPTASAAPTAAPATPTPAPTTAGVVTPLSAGPIVATFSGTTTSYTVEQVQGTGLKYQWAHSGTCGSHTGETTANYLWDHPHPPCPEEAFHVSFITVQVTDAAGFALVRQYPTLGSRPGRGAVPAGGGVFATQTPFPTTAVRTTAPATTNIATAAASTAPAASGGEPNYPLGLGGVVLTGVGLGFAFVGGRKEKDPCDQLRRREAAARASRDSSRERAAQIDRLHEDAERTRREAERTKREEAASKDDRQSWWEDAETHVRTYTNPDQRVRIERAEAAAREARAAADAAKAASGAAGDAAAAHQQSSAAEVDWQQADAALQDCVHANAPRPVAPAPQPPAPAPQPTPPTPPAPTPPTPPPTPVQVAPVPTQVRVCTPGATKPDSEQTNTHEYRVIDLRSATIVGSDEVSLSQGTDGDGPDGERGSGAFPEMFQYWHDATDIGTGRVRNAVTRDDRLQVVGEYSIRYAVRTYTMTCRTWQECNAEGTGFVRRHSTMMSAAEMSEAQTPPQTVDVPHADRNSVTREVLRVVSGIARELQRSNRAEEDAAKTFTSDCR